jgi:SAM-dependent methyltransferase
LNTAVTFAVPANAYDRFMGRYSAQLSAGLADLAGVRPGHRVLDVGCGPGALTAELVARVGAGAVAAVDPSESFVAACRARFPAADVRTAEAEALPFEDGRFDAALAQLVVHFMRDPVTGLREMGRVTREGGVVAACVWDNVDGMGMLRPFWQAATELDPTVQDESDRAGSRQGHLAELLRLAGLDDVQDTALGASVAYASFDEWWEPFLLGVGPAGAHAASLSPERLAELRELCRSRLPDGVFELPARAWAAYGVRP